MLSNVDIIQELKSNELKIDKFDSNRLQPALYDLTVGEAFFTRIQQEGSPENQETVFVVRPGEAATILTAEKVYLGDGISGHVKYPSRQQPCPT